MQNFFSQIDINKLFQLKYLFSQSPSPDGLYMYSAIFFVFLIISAILIKIFYKKARKIFFHRTNETFYVFLILGISGLLWVFSRYENINYLNNRLIFVLITILLIIELIRIIYYKTIVMPKEIQKIAAKEKFNKYLPKKKK